MPLTTLVESPQFNGIAEAFVRTFKRDYVEVNSEPDAATVIRSFPAWFEHYNDLHPHRALGYLTPVAFAANLTATGDPLRNPAQLRRSPLAPTAQPGAISPGALIATG